MKTLFRSALLAGALLGSTALAAQAQDARMPGPPPGAPHPMTMMAPAPVLSLSAYGEVKVAPDMATINLGVMTQAATAAEAMRLNRERMTGLIAALKRNGVAEKDIQTSGLNLSAQYAYKENQPPRLTGYQVSNNVTVIVYDLNRIGQTIDATVTAGGNQINGIGFGLKDPQAAEDAARLEAVKRVQAKAELYARAVGKRIVELKSLSEGGGYAPPPPMPMYRMEARAQAADASTPVAAGELSLRVDVQAVYEIER